MVVYKSDREDYGKLWRMMKEGKKREEIKGEWNIEWEEIMFSERKLKIEVFKNEEDEKDFEERMKEIEKEEKG